MAIFDKRSRSRVMNLLTFRDIRFLLIFRDLSKNSRKSAAPHFLVGAIFTEIVSRKSAAPHFLVGAIFTEITAIYKNRDFVIFSGKIKKSLSFIIINGYK